MPGTEIKAIKPSNLFSKLSFGFAIAGLVLFCMMINSVPSTLRTKHGPPAISKTLIACTLLSVTLGILFSIISLARREKLKYFKITGLVINMLLALLLTATTGFAFFMDWKAKGS